MPPPAHKRSSSSVGFATLLAAIAVTMGAPRPAQADCALIESALRVLPSNDGGVDRPYVLPGELVTVFSDSACKTATTFRHFNPDVTQNQVTIQFEPPHVAPPSWPAPIVFTPPPPAGPPAEADEKVADCGTDRCFALRFRIPDTSAEDARSLGQHLTGPARITVQNLVAGQQAVEIASLFEPAKGCNPANRIDNLFRQFSILPPKNLYTPGGPTTLKAAVDGSGALLIPFDFSAVLPTASGGSGTVRILTVGAGQDNGLTGGNGLASPDDTKLRVPQGSSVVRAWSMNGRPIPPLLVITASTPALQAAMWGDSILGSVDFEESLMRIAANDPDGGAPIFTLGNDPAGTGAGPAMVGEVGPVEFTNVTPLAGAAAPLKSLSISPELASLTRDEKLEAPFPGAANNGDGDDGDQLVAFTTLDDGQATNTNQPVAVVDGDAILRAGELNVAFFQSEAESRTDPPTPPLNGDLTLDGDFLDSILRVWTADGSHPYCVLTAAGLPCELTAAASLQPGDPTLQIVAPGDRGPLVLSGSVAEPGRFAFFGRPEAASLPAVGQRISQTLAGGDTSVGSTDPTVSQDGLTIAWTSGDGGTTGATAPVTWETGIFNVSLDSNTGIAAGAFVFDIGEADVAGLDYWEMNLFGGFLPGDLFVQSIPTANPLVFDVYADWTVGGTLFEAHILPPPDPDLGTAVIDALPITTSTVITTTGNYDSVSVDGLLGHSPPSAFGLTNLRSTSVVDSVTNIVPDGLGGVSYDASGWFTFDADGPVTVSQIYARPSFGGVGANVLISQSTSGEAADCAASHVSTDFDGDAFSFLSCASNLVAGPGGAAGEQVFVRDTLAGTTVRASHDGVGDESNGFARTPIMSGDGSDAAYISVATNIVAGTGHLFEVYLYDVALQTNQLVSVDLSGNPSGNAFYPGLGIRDDGQEVAFASDADDLVPGDTNAMADVFVRLLHGTPTTIRVSLGFAGAESDGTSYFPHMSGDGNIVGFLSGATNLLAPGAVTLSGLLDQGYVYDRATGVTEIVTVNMDGEPANTHCQGLFVSPTGRFVTYASTATNLYPGATTSQMRVYLYDRLTGAVDLISRAGPDLLAEAATGTRSAVADANVGMVVFDTTSENLPSAPGPADFNGVSDVYGAFLFDDGTNSLNSGGPVVDADSGDTVLFAFDTASATPDVERMLNSNLPVQQVAVADGRAAVIPNVGGVPAYIFDPLAGTVLQSTGLIATDVSLTAGVLCLVATNGHLWTGPPSGLGLIDTTEVVAQVQAVDAIAPVGPSCVFTDLAGTLKIANNTGAVTTNTFEPANDFQVSKEGIAFRSCEQDLGFDINLDEDEVDCVMRFWDFVQPVDPILGTLPNLFDTLHAAEPCTFPGCDPFFEPYRVDPGLLSFVTDETRGVNNTLVTGKHAARCLSTSPAGVCDKTGDDDGVDLAMELVNLRNRFAKSQVFKLSRLVPPTVSPFPRVREGDKSNVIVIQLPAQVVEQFQGLPPTQAVTLIIGDPDGDLVFEADANTDPQTATSDLCQLIANSDQNDFDNDGMGTLCDFTTVGATQVPNDDPVTAPEPALLPGENLCDLDGNGTITRVEVDQVWADRGTPITAPVERDALHEGLEPTDDRDPDIDGEITAVDFRDCLDLCAAQTLAAGDGADGCPADNSEIVTPPPSGSSGGYGLPGACGLLGIEALLVLLPLAWRRRRRARKAALAALAVGVFVSGAAGTADALTISVVAISPPVPILVDDTFTVQIQASGLGNLTAPSLSSIGFDLSWSSSVITLLTPSATDAQKETIFDHSSQVECAGASYIPGPPGPSICEVLVDFTSTASTATGDAASLFSDADIDLNQPGSFVIAELVFQAVGTGGTVIAFTDLDVSVTSGPATATGVGLIVGVAPEPGSALLLGLALVTLGAGLRPRLAG